MIAFVRGTVADVFLTSAVLEVGGVGLELNCTPNTLASLRHGTATTLPTSMIVREDSMTLYGFLDDDAFTAMTRRCDLRASDLIRIVMGVPGVLAVKSFSMRRSMNASRRRRYLLGERTRELAEGQV